MDTCLIVCVSANYCRSFEVQKDRVSIFTCEVQCSGHVPRCVYARELTGFAKCNGKDLPSAVDVCHTVPMCVNTSRDLLNVVDSVMWHACKLPQHSQVAVDTDGSLKKSVAADPAKFIHHVSWVGVARNWHA
eukprot:1157834-Pelagomonas_calceolata.AAC.8